MKLFIVCTCYGFISIFDFDFFSSFTSWIGAELSGEVGPGSGHLWHTFISHIEMMSLLVILYLICTKDWMSFL